MKKTDDWKQKAADWLEKKAAAQEGTNEKYPDHAKCYPSWVHYPVVLRRLAGELRFEE